MSVTNDGIGPCRHCGRRVPAATVCRACGFDTDTDRNRRDRFVWGVLGGLLVLSVIGAPLGALCCWKAVVHHRAMHGRAVTESPRYPGLVAAVRAASPRLRRAPGDGGS